MALPDPRAPRAWRPRGEAAPPGISGGYRGCLPTELSTPQPLCPIFTCPSNLSCVQICDAYWSHTGFLSTYLPHWLGSPRMTLRLAILGAEFVACAHPVLPSQRLNEPAMDGRWVGEGLKRHCLRPAFPLPLGLTPLLRIQAFRPALHLLPPVAKPRTCPILCCPWGRTMREREGGPADSGVLRFCKGGVGMGPRVGSAPGSAL